MSLHKVHPSAAVGLVALVLGAAPAETLDAQVVIDRALIGDVTRHIPSLSPLSGPHGTEVSVRMPGLVPYRNYQIAIGETQGCGYEICSPVTANARGVVTATFPVPDWTHTHHYEVVMIMGEDFAPIAVSDPFHVTDADGLVQRTGVVGSVWPGCPSLETEGGVTYALVGEKARTLLASAGHVMIITGRVVDSTCTLQYALEVETMELVPAGEHHEPGPRIGPQGREEHQWSTYR